MQLFMFLQAAGIVKSLFTNITDVRRLTGVLPDVHRQVPLQSKRRAAITAGVGPFATVRAHVVHQMIALRERLAAHLANERFLAGVGQNVQLQGQRASKRLGTVGAFVGFFTLVDSQVGLKCGFAKIKLCLIFFNKLVKKCT